MQKKTIRVIAFLSVAFLVACGDDNTSNGTTNANSSNDDSYASIDDLPNCTAKREGVSAFVEEDDATYVCNDGDWVKVGAAYESIDDFPNCTEKRKDESVLEQKTGKAYTCNGKSWEENGVVAKPVESSSSEQKSSGKETKTEEKSSSSAAEDSVLVDSRDGQTYRIVTIGTQTWMAENLNYAYLQPTLTLDSSSFCYNDSVSYCEKTGRLYLWSAAMDSAAEFSDAGKNCGYGIECDAKIPVRGVCPEGWHLPSRAEFLVLIALVGGKESAGLMLKSTNGWSNDGNVDFYGFSALPSGGYDGEFGRFYGYAGYIVADGLNEENSFWSSTVSSQYPGRVNAAACAMRMYESAANIDETGCSKQYAYSVRCLKD